MARGVDPPGLVEHDDPGPAVGHPPELASGLRVSEQIEEVARLPRVEARAGPAERAEARAREPDRAMELGEVDRRRRLPHPPRRLRHDAEREAARRRLPDGLERRAEEIAAVHLGAFQADRAHQRVDEAATGARRAAERDERAVGRGVVRADQHAPQEPVAATPGTWRAARAREVRHGDRQLEGRGRRERRARVPRRGLTRAEALDVDARRSGERGDETPHLALEALVEPGLSEARPGRPGEPEHVPDGATRAAAACVDGLDADRHLARREVHVERERACFEATLADDPTVDAHDDPRGSLGSSTADEAVRRLERHGTLDRRRRRRSRRRLEHDRTVAFAGACRSSPISTSTRSSPRWRSSRIPRCARSHSSSAAILVAVVSSRRRTTSRVATGSARR